MKTARLRKVFTPLMQISASEEGTRSLSPVAAEEATSHASRSLSVCKTQSLLPRLSPSNHSPYNIGLVDHRLGCSELSSDCQAHPPPANSVTRSFFPGVHAGLHLSFAPQPTCVGRQSVRICTLVSDPPLDYDLANGREDYG